MALLFEVVEELTDKFGVKVGDVETAGLGAGAGLHEPQQQTPGVPIGRHRVGTGMSLADEPIGEPRFQGRSERTHELFLPWWSWRLWAARASSSGTADKYQ